MLTNKELKDISKVIADLTLLEVYADKIEFPIGMTVKDIQTDRKILNHIHVKTKIQKAKQSEQANAWNKAHPERHNTTNKKYYKNKKLKEVK